jgi:hypothetical protein
MSETARALIVYESMFGNTQQIAEAVCEGLRGSVEVQLVRVDHALAAPPADLDLLVVGGPTHALGMSRPTTRIDASTQGEVVMPSDTGIREWLEQLPDRQGETLAATFDTRVRKARWLSGSAARGATKVLRRRGIKPLAPPASFFVEDIPGPLSDGEVDRARQWGRSLAEQLRSAPRRSTPRPPVQS